MHRGGQKDGERIAFKTRGGRIVLYQQSAMLKSYAQYLARNVSVDKRAL